jgi:demethylmenaquinone methyltransferase/2-methoxy-6-polyprenyl-1,4-benzoquinol methylase
LNGDIASLPFADGYFDCVGVSFAFRNLTYNNPLAPKYLSEILRVLRPGGRFVIIESSRPRSGPWPVKWLHYLYVRYLVYGVGWLVSGNREAYRYLAQSALHFYTAEELQKLLLGAGFRRVSFNRLLLGAAAIHVAIK